MVMTNRRGHVWKLEEGEENLRRKEGEDKEDDNSQECGGNVQKEERKRTKQLKIKKKETIKPPKFRQPLVFMKCKSR